MIQNKIYVAFVPQWVTEALQAHGCANEVAFNLSKLESEAILSANDLLFYVMINEKVKAMLGEPFHDMATLCDTNQNSVWVKAHQEALAIAKVDFERSPQNKDFKRRIETGSTINGPLLDFVPRATDPNHVLLFEKYSDGVPEVDTMLQCIDNTMQVLSTQRTFEGCKDLAVLKWFIVHDKNKPVGD